MKIPTDRAGFLAALLETEPPPPRKAAEPPKLPEAPRSRFEALQRVAIKPEALATAPVKPAEPELEPAPTVWESLVECWSAPRPGSSIDILVRGVQGRKDLPARPKIRDRLVEAAAGENVHSKRRPFTNHDFLASSFRGALALRADLEALMAEGHCSEREYTLFSSMMDGLLVDLMTKLEERE
jgi:hypothetical protein